MTFMGSKSESDYKKMFWVLLGAFTLFRLLLAGSFGLSTDESHYVMYSRNLAWGYFDHPPMVAALGALTGLLGKSVFYARLGPVICWTIAAVLLRTLILRMYDSQKTAFWSLLLLVLMPVQHLLAMALLPDATLSMFWCASLLMTWRALSNDKWLDWFFAGVFFGAAMLSKYHGVLLPACILCYVISSKEKRNILLTPKPYFAVLVGCIVFLPNVIWNYHNNWISYSYQLGHGAGSGQFSFEKIAESIGGQMAAATPVFFVMLLLAFFKMFRNKTMPESDRFLIMTSMPVFLFFCGIGFFGKILPHWPIVGWWTGSVLLVRYSEHVFGNCGDKTRWNKWLKSGAVTGLVMLMLMYTVITLPVINGVYNWTRDVSLTLHSHFSFIPAMEEYESSIDITNDLYGWDIAADEIQNILQEMTRPEKTFIFFHKFYNSSQLFPYVKEGIKVTTLSSRVDQYRLWFIASQYKGWDALFVDNDRWPKGSEKYMDLFERIDKNGKEIDIKRDDVLAHEFHVYKCYGFKGHYEQ